MTTLYLASTDDKAIFAIADAGERPSAAGPGFVVFADQQHPHAAGAGLDTDMDKPTGTPRDCNVCSTMPPIRLLYWTGKPGASSSQRCSPS